MTDKPNPEHFSVNEQEGKYDAAFDIRGTIRVRIDASDIDDAKSQAEAMLDDQDFGLELDEVDDAEVNYVLACPPMYRVLEDGQKMQVSHLRAGHTPREPDERGF